MSYNIETYLKFIQEKEWNEPDAYEKFMKVERLIDLIKDLEGAIDLNNAKHEDQPTLIGLLMTAGGDYMGRKDMSNAEKELYTGLKKLKKYLPKDWENKLRKSLGVDIKL